VLETTQVEQQHVPVRSQDSSESVATAYQT